MIPELNPFICVGVGSLEKGKTFPIQCCFCLESGI